MDQWTSVTLLSWFLLAPKALPQKRPEVCCNREYFAALNGTLLRTPWDLDPMKGFWATSLKTCHSTRPSMFSFLYFAVYYWQIYFDSFLQTPRLWRISSRPHSLFPLLPCGLDPQIFPSQHQSRQAEKVLKHFPRRFFSSCMRAQVLRSRFACEIKTRAKQHCIIPLCWVTLAPPP